METVTAKDRPQPDRLISVVVATRDRHTDLLLCVESILASNRRHLELIVVDQSVEAASLPEDQRIVYRQSDTVGKSAGLNVALSMVSGDVVAFTDDDCIVPADWLDRLAAEFDHDEHVDVTFGSLRAIEHDPRQHFVPTAEFPERRVVSSPSRAYVRGGAGANMAMRRRVLERLVGYDEQIGPGARFRACEEFDFYYRALVAGATVAFVPDVVVIHTGARPYVDGSGARLKRDYAYGEGIVIGKHLRCRDARMVWVLVRITLQDLAVIAESLRHRRLSGIGTTAHKWLGVFRALATRVDRSRRLFAPTPRPR